MGPENKESAQQGVGTLCNARAHLQCLPDPGRPALQPQAAAGCGAYIRGAHAQPSQENLALTAAKATLP